MTIQRVGTINQLPQRAARAAEPVAAVAAAPGFAPTTYVPSGAGQDLGQVFGQALNAIGAIAQAFQPQQQPGYYPQQPAYYPQQPAYYPQQPAYYPQPQVQAPQYAQPAYYPQPAYTQASVPGFLRPAAPTVASYPTYPSYPAASVQQPTAAAQAQIQQMMAQVAAIQAQIQQILAAPQGAVIQVPAVAPVAAPSLPMPAMPTLPSLPPTPAPALPTPPAPVFTAPAVTAPVATTPVAPITTPAPATAAGPFNFPSLQAGAQLRVADGTKVKGFSISGDGRINALTASNLDMTVNASAAFGMVKMTIGIKAIAQPDGTVRLTATELDKSGNAKKSLFDDNLKVVSSGPNELVLQDPTGKPGSIRVGADGSVTLDHPEGHLVLGRM